MRASSCLERRPVLRALRLPLGALSRGEPSAGAGSFASAWHRGLIVAGRRGISKGEVALPFGQGWVRNTVLRVENPQLPAEGEVQRGSGVGTWGGGSGTDRDG